MEMGSLWKAILLISIGMGMIFFQKYCRLYRLWELFNKKDEQTQVEILISKTIGIVLAAVGTIMFYQVMW